MRIRFRHGLLATILLPMLAQAWGPEGHRVIGALAQTQLTPQVAAAVADLLKSEPDPTLAGVANWADDLRSVNPYFARQTSRWHYVNIHDANCNYQPARDCRGGQCVVAAIDAQLKVLGDRSRSRADRAQALKFVVHLIGDEHQPFHAGNRDDRGGNDYQINIRGYGTNLHAVWDGTILPRAAADPERYAAQLAKTPVAASETRIDGNAPQRWAEESCRSIDANGLYPRKHTIDDAYLQAHRALAEQRLRLAGARLAAELNATLGVSARR